MAVGEGLQIRGTPQAKDSSSVLLLEKDPGLRRVIKLTLKQLGVEVLEAKDIQRAQQFVKSNPPDLLVIDLDAMETSSRLITVFRNQCEDGEGAVLITTASRPDDQWRKQHQPDAVVYKPFDVRFLCRRIITLME